MASTSYGSSNNNNYVFDIFINHRGPDCKKTLAKHLYDRLREEGLQVFLDEHELQSGENITPQIKSAIRTASVHIAIFTPRYAESNWCLDELLLMFQSGSTIIPVFYGGVKPADLRWGTRGEKGVYGRALQELEKKTTFDSEARYDPTTIQKWRKALTDAAEIKGFDMETYNGDEQQLLQHVVEGVLKKVKRRLHVSRYPTGLDEKVAEFEGAMLLDQRSSRETRVIGIVGLGGAGKTTLAKENFNRRRSYYKRTYFQFDVRENVARNSLKYLQSMILSGLAQVNVQIDSTDDGIEKLHSYLQSSHAFLILDDVDHLQQVEALLLPVKDVVEQGSLILVTSRNKDILTGSGITESSIFKLTGLDQDHSLELFCHHAFDQRYPPIEFEQVVAGFVDACAGLPLSLKVLGSLLLGKDLEYGKAQLHDISKILPEGILATLKISYDSLHKIEKQIFLDIVCFFMGENKDTAIRIWDGTEWGGRLRLGNLERRCLVEVDNENRIRMHDHVRDLGRHIAESEPPESTLRLSCPTHDLRLLSDKSLVRGISTIHSRGCERAQPLFINLAEFAGSSLPNYVRRMQLISTEGGFGESIFSCACCVMSFIWLSWVDFEFGGSRFKNYVRGLQLLRTEGYIIEPEFMERIISVATSLIWLSWVDYPYSYIPSWIPLKNLRVLRIEGRELETLWLHESQAPEHLRELHIEATRLKVPKSIGKLRHLEKFVVADSLHLTLPAELCHLQSLKHLELRGYPHGDSHGQFEFDGSSSLNILPDSFGNLMSLENLSFSGWSNLEVLPDSFGKLRNLQTIDLSDCHSLQVLPDSFGNLTNLQTIVLRQCSLQVLPDSFGKLTNLQTIDLSGCSILQVLPDSFEKLTSLQAIDLSQCSSLQVLPDSFGNLTNLQTIHLKECESLQVLPDSFGKLTNLQTIHLSLCYSLQVLPDSFGNLTNFQTIDLRWCSSLQVLPDSFGKLMNLQTIDLSRCSSLQVLPDSFGKLTNLQTIDLTDCNSLQVLLDSFGNLTNLQTINMWGCSSLQVLPDSFGNLTNLKTINMWGCSSLRVLPDSFGKLTNLQTIDLSRCSSLQVLPDSFGKLTNLQTIALSRCSSLQVLPDSFEKLTNLQSIDLEWCSSLQVLPDSFEKLTNLQTIHLCYCRSLQVLPDSFGNFPNFTNLQTIDLSYCRSLQVLPDSFGKLTNLQTIHLSYCQSLQMLPDSFGKLTNLQTIHLSYCRSLQVLPDSFGNLTNFQTIELRGCSSLQVLPNSFGKLTNLQTIHLSDCSNLQVLPDSFGKLTNLQTIDLSRCSSLQVLPDSFGKLTNLQTINLSYCSSLQVLPDSFGKLTNLQTIDLSSCSSLQVLPESFGKLTNLQTINLSYCSSLQVLPDSFGSLIQLEDLQFRNRLTVSPEVFEKMHTFKCSGIINFNWVEVLPAPSQVVV